MKPAALIVAAGRGTRIGGDRPKQYELLGGEALLARTAGALLRHGGLAPVRVVIHRDHRPLYDEAVADLPGLGEPIIGGDTRQQSVLHGLEAFETDRPETVIIHDAARPFVDSRVISRVVAALEHHDGAVAATPVTDTILREQANLVAATVDRDGLWAAQTPQGFRFAPILAAHRKASADGAGAFTDDASVARWAGLDVAIAIGDPLNRKITTGEDLEAARRLFAAAGTLVPRVGHGYDVHAFEPGDHVMLCGVRIPHDAALKGHSDADVGLHALTDAILGALCEGDIGQRFPPADDRWRGAGSEIFLRDAGARVAARGGAVAHIDVTLICEAPKIASHAQSMRLRIGEILELPTGQVSVKATTTEGLGFTGRREGIAAYATATVMLPV